MVASLSKLERETLKSLYRMARDGHDAHTGALAERLGVSPATATTTVQIVSDQEDTPQFFSTLNGNAVTVADRLWEEMLRHGARAEAPDARERAGSKFSEGRFQAAEQVRGALADAVGHARVVRAIGLDRARTDRVTDADADHRVAVRPPPRHVPRALPRGEGDADLGLGPRVWSLDATDLTNAALASRAFFASTARLTSRMRPVRGSVTRPRTRNPPARRRYTPGATLRGSISPSELVGGCWRRLTTSSTRPTPWCA